MGASAKGRQVIRRLIRRLPASNVVYRVCREYVDAFNGDNDDDFRRNGELRLMRELLPGCRTVFDVGANVGAWASEALKLAPTAMVHCFEPSLETFRVLKGGVGGSPGVIVNNFALGRAPGAGNLFVYSDGAGHNSLYHREGLADGWGIGEPQRREAVRIETGDEYCAKCGIERVEFCKLDVEGHELEVLIGMDRTLRAGRIRAIQFEYGGCNIDSRTMLKDLFGLLASYGYQLFKVFPDGRRLVPRYDQRLETFRYQNWIAILS